jgi:UDP-arabinose 4-epimerase
MPKVIVTGGAGFIGSHTCKALAAAGIDPIVFDNLSTGNRRALQWGEFEQGDLLDEARFRGVCKQHRPDAIFHFAASAYVGESATVPEKYYRNNIAGTLSVLAGAVHAGVSKIVFSSSCATYGHAAVPITESSPQLPINPYGRTKLVSEWMLDDFASAYGLRYAALRYFNAAGADPTGELGEWHDPETHLIPRALLAAAGKLPALEIYGTDYPTVDGTCLRDFIHVADLARAHVDAYRYLENGGANRSINLGSGRASSVRMVVEAVEAETGRPVPVAFHPRRQGDPAELVADIGEAREVLGFSPDLSDLSTIVRTAAPFFLSSPVSRPLRAVSRDKGARRPLHARAQPQSASSSSPPAVLGGSHKSQDSLRRNLSD